jgi:hypothetical protein
VRRGLFWFSHVRLSRPRAGPSLFIHPHPSPALSLSLFFFIPSLFLFPAHAGKYDVDATQAELAGLIKKHPVIVFAWSFSPFSNNVRVGV